MDPQIANFFTRYTEEVEVAVTAILALQDRRQEAIDRGIAQHLSTIDFSEYGDLAYLSEDRVIDATAALDALVAALSANGRAGWTALFGVIP